MLLHSNISDEIIHSFYHVYNELGYGFLEKVYQKALLHELQLRGCTALSQQLCQVYYKGLVIGEYYADILVQDAIILELKASEAIINEHKIQLLNYLKATNIEVGFVLNFGKKPEFERIILTNDRKRR